VSAPGERWATRAAWLLGLAALTLYAVCRARWVGGSDPTSYLLESYRLRGVDVGLGLDPTVPFRGALAPLGMVEHHGAVISWYPPGFPLLLAAGGTVGLEFHVNAVLGAGSGLALFALVRERAGSVIALAAMAAWLASPIVIWGSTSIMSDLPAAALLLFVLLALRRGRPLLAGVIFGFSLGVRPTELLFLPALVLFAPQPRALRQVTLGVAASLLGWALFIRVSLGSFELPYASNLANITGEHYGTQLAFLLRATATQLAPVVALAVVGLALRPKAVVPELVWFATFLFFYALWGPPFDAWWYTRYLLPANPALFLCAAEGAAALLERTTRPRLASAAAALAVAGYTTWSLGFSMATPQLSTTWYRSYQVDVARVARLVPDAALVGALNHSGPLRFYGGLQSFFWCHVDTPALVQWGLEHERPLFAVLDDWERSGCFPGGAAQFELVERLPSGKPLYRLSRSSAVEASFARGQPGVAMLADGWSEPEDWGVWATGTESTLNLRLSSDPFQTSGVSLRVTTGAFLPPGINNKTIDVFVGEPTGASPIAQWKLTRATEQKELCIPASAIPRDRIVKLTFKADRSYSPAADSRVLNIALQSLSVHTEPCLADSH
jgi:hypothetical protein